MRSNQLSYLAIYALLPPDNYRDELSRLVKNTNVFAGANIISLLQISNMVFYFQYFFYIAEIVLHKE
jgi:hypothetical protein